MNIEIVMRIAKNRGVSIDFYMSGETYCISVSKFVKGKRWYNFGRREYIDTFYGINPKSPISSLERFFKRGLDEYEIETQKG